MKNRLLFVDILKIVGILFVLLEHLYATEFYPWLDQYYLKIDIYDQMYYITYATLGIWLFIIASGCSLAINYPSIDSKEKIKEFYTKRFLRIYPAYWTAILFAIVMHPDLLEQKFVAMDYVKIISGFESFGAYTYADFLGKINNNFWFIALILSLYLLFPIILFAVKKHPHGSMLSLFTISVVSRYYMSHSTAFVAGTSWFPLCNVFGFGLGIYLIRTGLYLKRLSNNVVVYLSNISFFVYLINGPLLHLSYYPTVFIVALIVIGTMMYKFDEAVKDLINSTWTRLQTIRSVPR